MSDIDKWADITKDCTYIPDNDIEVLKTMTAFDSIHDGNESDYDDTRKRPLDLELDMDVKKSHQSAAHGIYHFKILIPSVVAGAIIGKGGETIAMLQKEAGARVKMSKATDFYPGTTERVCLITGNVEGISHIHDFIMEKIKERPDPNAKMAIDFDHKQPAEREKQVKILVPNSTAGMIMGKGGSYIKQIKEESGAYVQISQKSKDYALAERCITVIGEMESNRKACHMILLKIVEDPQSGSCLNVSYADVTGPVPNFNPTGSPFANPESVPSGTKNSTNTSYSSNSSLNSLSPTVNNFHSPRNDSGNISGIAPFADMGINVPTIHPNDAAQAIETIKIYLRGNGFSEQAVSEISSAMSTLVSYGILGLDINGVNEPVVSGMRMPNSAITNCSMPLSGMANMGMYTTATGVPGMDGISNTVTTSNNLGGGSSIFSPVGNYGNGMTGLGLGPSFSSPPATSRANDRFFMQPDGSVFESFQRTSPTLASPSAAALPVNNNSFGLGTGLNSGSPNLKGSPSGERPALEVTKKTEIGVAENIVGAILGPCGKSLVEIQRYSGANIQISKKGIYTPGTRNRIVTITGHPKAVDTANYLIERQIAEEEAERAQNNAMGVLH